MCKTLKIGLLALLLFGSSAGAFAQQISGKVFNKDKEPLIGVTIVEQGSSNATTTDMDGSFVMTVKSSESVLVFSYVGFKHLEIKVGNKTELEIILEEFQNMLSETVVSTALGMSKKLKKIGYATQKVALKQIQNNEAPSFASLLTGQVAGLQINNPTGMLQNPQILLRGKQPIIVIDGIRMHPNDIMTLSPEFIDTINVLRGPAAAAIYGGDGRNGAIVITTKNAKEEGVKVEIIQNNLISAGFTVYPEYQTEYGSGSNGKYEFWDGRDGGISDGDMTWGPKFGKDKNGQYKKIKQWNSPIREKATGKTIPWYGDVLGSLYDNRTKYERVPIDWKRHDNLGDFLRTANINMTSFSIASKSKKTAVRFSGHFNSQKGRVPNTETKRGGLNFIYNTKITDKLKFNTFVNYVRLYSPNKPFHGYRPANHMYTILIWMSDDVNGKDLEKHQWRKDKEGLMQANYNYAWYNNPYFAAYKFKETFDRRHFRTQMKLTYDIIDDLFIRLRGSFARNAYDTEINTPKSYKNYGTSRGQYKIAKDHTNEFYGDVLLNYNTEFIKDVLAVNLNLGASIEYLNYQKQSSNTDGALIVPEVYNLANAFNRVTWSYFDQRYEESMYAVLSLDVLNSIYLNFTARNDKLSTLPKDNRNAFYPSASVSYVISDMFKDQLPDLISNLSVRTSWAQVKDGFDPYVLKNYYSDSDPWGTNTRLSYGSDIENANLQPEQTTTLETGFSAGFFKNRITLDFNYFKNVDTNFKIKNYNSLASGYRSSYVNGNEYTKTGSELSLGAKPILTKDFTWRTNINISTIEERITKIYETEEARKNREKENKPARYGNLFLNERLDSAYLTVWERNKNGQLILNSNGLPIKDRFRRNMGHWNPDFVWGFQNNFRYKNFTLSINMDGAVGGIIWSKSAGKMWWGGKHKNSTKYRDAQYASKEPVYLPDGVVQTGGEVKYDEFGNITSDTRTWRKNTKKVNWQTWSQNYPYRASVLESKDSFFANVFSRTFFKLRTVALSYDFTEMLNIKGIDKLQLTLSGYNLYTFSYTTIEDPDFGNDKTSDRGNLQDPATRFVGLGLNVKF